MAIHQVLFSQLGLTQEQEDHIVFCTVETSRSMGVLSSVTQERYRPRGEGDIKRQCILYLYRAMKAAHDLSNALILYGVNLTSEELVAGVNLNGYFSEFTRMSEPCALITSTPVTCELFKRWHSVLMNFCSVYAPRSYELRMACNLILGPVTW